MFTLARGLINVAMAFLVVIPGFAAAPMAQATVRIENASFLWEIGADGRNLSFRNKHSGLEHVSLTQPVAFSRIHKDGKDIIATSVSRKGDLLDVKYGGGQYSATIKVLTRRGYSILEVVDTSKEAIDSLTFLDLTLATDKTADTSFGACALALNLQTCVPDLPGPWWHPRVLCYPRFGLVGARTALVAGDPVAIRALLKRAMLEAPGLPHSPLGGPWALDAKATRGSYLIGAVGLSERTVDNWIRLAKATGTTQLDVQGGKSFRFGDLRLDPEAFPAGRASLKAVIGKLHAAGIKVGLHTYGFFLDKHSEWVSPRPDPRLAKAETFTLATDLDAKSTEVPVLESTEGVSTVTAFSMRNSVTLQIDDEMITFGARQGVAPYGFKACIRGVNGTRAEGHKKEAKVFHLKECFGMFLPDGESTLFEEVAARTASLYNDCGFDMIYLDAIDGADLVGGMEAAWHYAGKFVFALWKGLKRPALLDLSMPNHLAWLVRSRAGAWDYPTRGYREAIDGHVAVNEVDAQHFLPQQLGWWRFLEAGDPRTEPMFPEDIEYLYAKALGTDACLSLIGILPDDLAHSPRIASLAEVARRFEALRAESAYFPEALKARLREPGLSFSLVQDAAGHAALRPYKLAKKKFDGEMPEQAPWVVDNGYAAQPVHARIEALPSLQEFEAPGTVPVGDFAIPSLEVQSSGKDVEAGIAIPRTLSGAQRGGGSFFANLGPGKGVPTSANGAPWARVEKRFPKSMDLSRTPGLGLWVLGDGQGEVLNIQVRGAEARETFDEHYVKIDFVGWKYLRFLEPEGSACAGLQWPYSAAWAKLYRESPDLHNVGGVALWYTNLTPGRQVACQVGPIRALGMLPGRLVNPTLVLDGKRLTFPVTIEAGSYLEFQSMTECKLFNAQGVVMGRVKPEGEALALRPGANQVEFHCDAASGGVARAQVTIQMEEAVLQIRKGRPIRGN